MTGVVDVVVLYKKNIAWMKEERSYPHPIFSPKTSFMSKCKSTATRYRSSSACLELKVKSTTMNSLLKINK